MKTVRTILFVIFVCLVGVSTQAQDLDRVLARLQSSSPQERVGALRQLAEMEADLRASKPMLNALCDSSSNVRREALTTWGRVAEAYADAFRQAQLPRKRATQEQYEVAEEAEQNWHKNFIAAVETCAADRSNSIRQTAVRTLVQLCTSVEALFPPYEGWCATGIELSLSYKAKECLDKIAKKQPSLLFSLVNEQDKQIAYGVTSTLAQVKYPNVYPILRRFLLHSEPVWRMIGCAGLSHKDNPDPDILPLLSDPDVRVRECAVHNLKDWEKIRARLAGAFPQPDAALRWSTIRLLTFSGAKQYYTLIKAACSDPDREVMSLALGAAVERRLALSPGYLAELLTHPFPPVRREAAKLLWQQEEKKTIPRLLPLLEDPEETVRQALIECMRLVDDPRLPAPILKAYRLSKRERNSSVVCALYSSWRYSRPLILQAMKDKEARIRALSAQVLGAVDFNDRMERLDDPPPPSKINSAELQAGLEELSRDSSPKVRVVVADAVSQYYSERAPTWAARITIRLLEDTDKNVCLEVMRLLRCPEDSQLKNQMKGILYRLSGSADKQIAEAAEDAKDNLASPGGVSPY
jgi:HEAT repeat protein